ncbi:hypothetical protein GOZ90_21255 [Agrobacterium vitis]|uniref:Uncharacterized protein n=1 Tax=Agrobacterium vitis TaxID=373 RepID=A0A6L6VJG3_AGRVI|nr:hypothetical protein [Agrobacterium vitis]MUZ75221.1 hypothetical protein [Agrobacterium vitis]
MQNSQNRTSLSALSAQSPSYNVDFVQSLLAFQSDSIDNLSYIDGSFKVAAGCSFNPPVVSQADDVWMLTFECNGKPDPNLAFEFTSLCGGEDRICTIDGDTLSPRTLNFYAKIDMTFKLKGDKRDVALFVGQSDDSFGHVWWLGGLPLANVKIDVKADATVLLPFADETGAVVQILQVTNRDGDLFQLTPWL